MPRYKIEFEVTDRSIYYTSVEADSPEQALELWRDDPNQYDANPDDTIECTDLLDTAECVGEWMKEGELGLSSLKRYNEPIKLK